MRWLDWQGKKVSNPRPTVLETVALPAELFPYIMFSVRYRVINSDQLHLRNELGTASCCWWAFRDSNPGPTGYEPVALTN